MIFLTRLIPFGTIFLSASTRFGHHLSGRAPFSTFSGVDILICKGSGITQFPLVTDSRTAVTPQAVPRFWIYAYVWTCPRRTYNGWRSPPSSSRRYRPHQTYKTFRYEELYDGGKYCLEYILQPAAAEQLNGVMVRSHTLPVSHKADIIAAEFFYATAGINLR